MTAERDSSLYHGHTEADAALLQRELDEAHKTIRTLLRQISKEQQRSSELLRAYNLTVSNLGEISRENTILERERDMWKFRTESAGQQAGYGYGPVRVQGLTIDMSSAEASAIRKAMARIHHPDTGGDPERMKLWNALLDPLER